MSQQPFRQFKDTLSDAQSMGADVTSSSKNLDGVVGYAVQFVWSGGGSPVGTFSLEASNDDENYTTISGSSFSVSGNSGNYLANVQFAGYSYVRAKYVRTSGSGTLTIDIVGKAY